MSEENNKEIIAESKIVDDAEDLAPVSESLRNRRPLYIALAVIGVVIAGALLFWYFRSRERRTGRNGTAHGLVRR